MKLDIFRTNDFGASSSMTAAKMEGILDIMVLVPNVNLSEMEKAAIKHPADEWWSFVLFIWCAHQGTDVSVCHDPIEHWRSQRRTCRRWPPHTKIADECHLWPRRIYAGEHQADWKVRHSCWIIWMRTYISWDLVNFSRFHVTLSSVKENLCAPDLKRTTKQSPHCLICWAKNPMQTIPV